MPEEPGIKPNSAPFHWRREPPPSRPWRSRLGVALSASVFALVWALVVVGVVAGGPVDSVSIEHRPPARLVLGHWRGRTSTHRLTEVSRLRPVRIGLRSADNRRGGDQILEIRIGTKTYRTGPVPYDWPDGAEGDVRQLESALRQACPHAVSEALVNRTTWVSDTGG